VRVGRKARGLLDKRIQGKAATIDGWFRQMEGNVAFSLFGYYAAFLEKRSARRAGGDEGRGA
jgi:hypothetical protein